MLLPMSHTIHFPAKACICFPHLPFPSSHYLGEGRWHNKLYWEDGMESDEGVILLFQKVLMNVVSQTFDLRGSGGSTQLMTKALCVPHYCHSHFLWLGASGIVSNIFNWANAEFPSCCVTDKEMNLQRNAMKLTVWVHKLSQLFTTRKIRLRKWSRFFEGD